MFWIYIFNFSNSIKSVFISKYRMLKLFSKIASGIAEVYIFMQYIVYVRDF